MTRFFSFFKNPDLGLLVLRLGMGVMFMVHGVPKLTGGPPKWIKLGKAMENLGIDLFPGFWGLMAALAETFGGALMAVGLFFRPALFFLTFTMVVATLAHLGKGDSVKKASHAIEAGVVFLGILFIGPGKYSLDYLFFKKK